MSLKSGLEIVLQSSTQVKNSAWISERINERSIDSQSYSSDPKYKKYVQQVEKCLNSFDNVHEWADCIAFLKQLLKTFQSYSQFKEIPRKLIVSKRLAQCLNPALPSGVHQRALEVYVYILNTLGVEGLNRNLSLWSAGLFPFFAYASTSVKPTLLNVYETYYLPLQAGLRPIMKSFILALLPGLEEETGEFFDMVLNLLDRLSRTISLSFFIQNIWLVMLTNPSARGTSLNFLARRLPLLNAKEDNTDIVGKDIGLMIRAFASALEDENLLVRRSAFDILISSLRTDSYTILKAQKDDQHILMRAATGVVLRRDSALNRRLYTWLLGADDKSDLQVAYLKNHALELLTATLKDEMFSPSKEYAESRPFKIFISLLDKWEIGAILTENIVFDAFKSVMKLIHHPTEGGQDLSMTANTLYEAVEPQILWKHLLTAVFAEIRGEGNHVEAIDLVQSILNSFSHDEEIQSIHLPIIFPALIELINLQMQKDLPNADSKSIGGTLHLLGDMLAHIPPSNLLQHSEITPDFAQDIRGPLNFAVAFYKIPETALEPSPREQAPPFSSCFQSLVNLSITLGRHLVQEPQHAFSLRDALSQTLTLLTGLLGRPTSSTNVSWDPQSWLNFTLSGLVQKSATFEIVDQSINLMIALHQNQYLEPKLVLEERAVIYKIISILFRYLHPDFTMYHVRAVNLLWSLQGSTTVSSVESVVAQLMTAQEPNMVTWAYEAFGVLWRLTEDNQLPGFSFKVPMMIILETLKSDNPNVRRVGEMWMRCSLKSYLRVLDPLLYDLLDPAISKSPTTFKVRGREISGFFYDRSFDQRIVNHLLDVLLSIVVFGGQGFVKAARTSSIKRAYRSRLAERVTDCKMVSTEATYLDLIIEILLRFIQSEPKPTMHTSMQLLNSSIQANAIELLQIIITRGEVENMLVESIEAITIGKLYFSIHMSRLELQNKLLHLMHSVLSLSTSLLETSRRVLAGKSDDFSSESHVLGEKNGNIVSRYSLNPLMVQTLVDGISVHTNRPILQHWLDFILMAVPQIQPALYFVVAPLNDCLCRQTLSVLGDILRASAGTNSEDIRSTVTDSELIMLLNALERLILLSLSYKSEQDLSEDEANVVEKTLESSGLLGYVSNVFSSESNSNQSEQLTSRSLGYRSLDEGIRVLYSVWASLIWKPSHALHAKEETLSLVYSRTRIRCRRVLEHLFRAQSTEAFESIVDWWSRDLTLLTSSPDAAFELLDALVNNAQNAVHTICESISSRLSAPSERSKRITNPALSDVTLFKFLEQYLLRLEGPVAIQVWSRYIQLIRENFNSSREFKTSTFYALRCLGVLADKVIQTTAMEDRKIRKELQENYGKLLDSCLLYVGRFTDQGSWIRRSTKELVSNSGRESPALRNEYNLKQDEKSDGSTLLPETAKFGSIEVVEQINIFVAFSALPNLRKFLVENDRIINACNNVIYYIVNPGLRGKTRPMDVDTIVIQILQEMTHIPAALKCWKTPVTDLLNDNRLFNCNPEDAGKWLPIIKVLYDNDKATFPELLNKLANTPSANIFTNREYEMLIRSLNLRRLSCAIFSGEKNHCLTQLPTIQEKLVDIFRAVSSPVVQTEVFLCIRVLLCRLSPHNLTSFWPVILTEMYRIFEQAITHPPQDGSEELHLILSACKCLDTLLVLQTEEFQIYQWIFITDTIDAVYRPDNWFPDSMMDQLSEIASNLPIDDAKKAENQVEISSLRPERAMRRPLLASRQIESIRDLIPFLSSISISSYESVYASGGNIDWEAVEKSIMDDMFDGR